MISQLDRRPFLYLMLLASFALMLLLIGDRAANLPSQARVCADSDCVDTVTGPATSLEKAALISPSLHIVEPGSPGAQDNWPVLYLPILVKNVATEPADSISFAVIGDFGLPGDQAADVSALVASWAVDFVVTVGDNRYGGATYDSAVGQYYCDFLSDVAQDPYCAGGNSPVNAFFPAVGNHEYSDSAGINEYLSYFVLPGDNVGTLNTSGSERYYDVIQGPVHLFFLDSEAARNGYDRAGQQEWLQTSLADTSAHWKLVILHHAPYSSAEHGSQTYMQWPYGEWGASLVLAGHDHSYERLTVDSLPYFVNGLGGNPGIYEFGEPTPGSQLRYNGDWGAQRITANEDWLTVQFITRAGILVDSLTLVH